MRYLFVLLLVSGCAMTYVAPTRQAPDVQASDSAAIGQKIASARRALISEGFQVVSADDASGTLSTAPRDFRVGPQDADCGKTAGLDYLQDPRTATRVSYGVIATRSAVKVVATIEAQYRPGSQVQDITLTCVSTGRLERELLARIVG